MLHPQKVPLIFTATVILVAAVGLLLGQINTLGQPEIDISQFAFNSQLRYIDQTTIVLSRFQDFRQNYVILSAVLLIFAGLTWCSNSCLCRWLPYKENKNRE